MGTSLFLLTFLSIYGGMHGYFFIKATRAFSLGAGGTAALIAFLVVLATVPVTARLLENGGHGGAARAVAYPGYLWMGFLFLFFCSALTFDIVSLGLALSRLLSGRELFQLAAGSRGAFLISCAVAAGISAYSYTEALRIRTEHLTIPTAKLPPDITRLRVVQISDVHLGLIVREERLELILAAVRAAEPDLLVATGDLLDGQPDGYSSLARHFRDIRPSYGKFAVTGNHEFYVGVKRAEEFAAAAGFTLLRGEAASVAGIVTVVGVDDPVARRGHPEPPGAERDLLAPLPRKILTLFLKHRPTVEPASLGLFDLQLSGHVHKGQIFPFNLVTHLFYPQQSGLSPVGKSSFLYVSRGAGTWGPPLRFLAPPEVTVIDFVHGEKVLSR